MSAAVADDEQRSPEGPALLCSLYEHAQVGVVQIKSDGRLYWANAALCRMLGYNPRELIDQNFEELLVSRDKPHRIEIETALAPDNGSRKTNEQYLLHRSGIPIWTSMTSLSADRSPKNVCTSIVRHLSASGPANMHADMSNRNVDASVYEGEDELRLLLDSTVEGIIGIDLEGRSTFCNRSALQMLKYESNDRVIGQDIHGLIHHTQRDGTSCEREQCSILKALHNGESVYFEHELLWRADRTSFETELWCRPRRRQ